MADIAQVFDEEATDGTPSVVLSLEDGPYIRRRGAGLVLDCPEDRVAVLVADAWIRDAYRAYQALVEEEQDTGDRALPREDQELAAVGLPEVHCLAEDLGDNAGSEAARQLADRFTVTYSGATDDDRPARMVRETVMVDASWLRQLVASARAAGWAE